MKTKLSLLQASYQVSWQDILIMMMVFKNIYKQWSNLIIILKIAEWLRSVAIVTVVIALYQMSELEFVTEREIELDEILLVIAQLGTYIYTGFAIIGGGFHTVSKTIGLCLPV